MDARSGVRHSRALGAAIRLLPTVEAAPGDWPQANSNAGTGRSAGLVEAYEHNLPKDHPLYSLYLCQRPGESHPQPVVNMLMHHGVRSCLEYARSADAAAARQLSNPQLAPHLSFLDLAGHGYAVIHAHADLLECEFVCIDRPLERAARDDGGPLRYRVVHRAALWKPGEQPDLRQQMLEGCAELSI